ncbi:MAG: alpha/beta fold hydrolase [Saprospiraceae bacterium]|nr:alpha/beta fold hydrolase [Saprospiraceae bacterium]
MFFAKALDYYVLHQGFGLFILNFMTQLNYKEYGSGEPIVILHGLLGMLDNWHALSKKMAEDYWVISIDQRNHGKSFHSDQFSYQLLADDLNQFLMSKHIPSAHLLGHSMGGKTVMQFLNDYSDMANKAIIVDISPKEYEGGHEKIFESLLAIDLTKVQSRKEVENELMAKLDNLGTVLFLMKNLKRKPEGGFEWKANISKLYASYDNIKGSVELDFVIDNPTLFIKGNNSNYITEEDQKNIKTLFDDVQFLDIDDAGHWVHADQPEILLKGVKDFLKA